MIESLRALMVLVAFQAVAALGAQRAKAGSDSRPNVILNFADDISAREFPIYGSTVWSGFRGDGATDPAYRARMPVVDRTPREGVWFANRMVAKPSRRSIRSFMRPSGGSA